VSTEHGYQSLPRPETARDYLSSLQRKKILIGGLFVAFVSFLVITRHSPLLKLAFLSTCCFLLPKTGQTYNNQGKIQARSMPLSL